MSRVHGELISRRAVETGALVPHTSPPQALLRQIAETTGMPFPNLVYRILAEHPGRLEACWGEVSEGLRQVGWPALRHHVLQPVTGPAGWEPTTALLPDAELDVLLDVLSTYERGNACNAVVVRLLLHGSAGGATTRPAALVPPPTVREPLRPLPAMSALSVMSPAARSSVQHVAAALDPSGAVVPSLLRHLAQSPEALHAVERVVDHANELGELGRRSLVMQRRVEEAAAAWPTSVRPVTEDGARTVLLRFGAVIPRMLALSSLLRESLDH